MIMLTGFDVRSFHYLLALFAPVFQEYTPFGDENGYIQKKKMKRGRPHRIQAIDCSGLLLGLKFVIDSAFSTANINFLIKSSQDYLTADDGLDTYEEQVDNIAVKRAATSMRQSAEWGVGAVQSSFPRLKDTMKYEEQGERRYIFTCLFLLYNLRARLVGINQIRNVYMPNFNAHDANVEFVPVGNI